MFVNDGGHGAQQRGGRLFHNTLPKQKATTAPCKLMAATPCRLMAAAAGYPCELIEYELAHRDEAEGPSSDGRDAISVLASALFALTVVGVRGDGGGGGTYNYRFRPRQHRDGNLQATGGRGGACGAIAPQDPSDGDPRTGDKRRPE